MNAGFKRALTVLLVALVVAAGGCIKSEDGGRQATTTATTAEAGTSVRQTSTVSDVKPTSTLKNTGQAKLVITEYSDFECPFCKASLPTLRKIKAVYANQIEFKFKNFPLTMLHANAEKAAQAAECARRQGKFWTYHDVLFENQGGLSVPELKSYAREIGLDQQSFVECLDGNRTFEAVKKDFEGGRALGVESTPTFFVGETMIVGAQEFSVFENEIDKLAPGLSKNLQARVGEKILSLSEESCVDGVLNQGEERADCGGPCAGCETGRDELASCLNDADSVYYYSSACPRCANQIQYFKDSFSLLKTVDCGLERGRCASDGIGGYPTWVISGRKYVGASIDSVKKLAGCG